MKPRELKEKRESHSTSGQWGAEGRAQGRRSVHGEGVLSALSAARKTQAQPTEQVDRGKFLRVCRRFPRDLVPSSHAGSGLRRVGGARWGIHKRDTAEAWEAPFGPARGSPLPPHEEHVRASLPRDGRPPAE